MELSVEDFLGQSEPLTAALIPYVTDGPVGKMIHHPLVIQINFQPLYCKMINDAFAHKMDALERYLGNNEFDSAIFVHERPYRLDALVEYVRDYGFDRSPAFWPTLSSVWTDSENIRENYDEWVWLWESTAPNRDLVMTDEEKSELANLPEKITIYRGIKVPEPNDPHGMSWTIDRDKAIWFANRLGGNGVLFTATIEKSKVLAHILRRGESEIVVHPDEIIDARMDEL